MINQYVLHSLIWCADDSHDDVAALIAIRALVSLAILDCADTALCWIRRVEKAVIRFKSVALLSVRSTRLAHAGRPVFAGILFRI